MRPADQVPGTRSPSLLRRPLLTSITTLLFASTGAYAAPRTGLIVDQAGRPLPRTRAHRLH